MKNGYDAVPEDQRRLILVRYDQFPFMLVELGHRLADGTYRWVSDWEDGHQNLGTFNDHSILAIMPTEEGKKLEKDLKNLTNEYMNAINALHAKFIQQRNNILSKNYIKAP